MNHDQTKITSKQLMFTIACFIQSSTLLSAFISALTKQDTWMAAILGFLIVLPIIWVYRSIMVRYSSKNLIEILEDVFGTVIGKILGIIYLFFFFLLTTFNLSSLGSLTKLTMLNKTPITVITSMCIIVAAYGIGYGIKVITRFGKLFTMMSLVITGLSVVLLLSNMDLQNFLPMFRQPFINYVQGTHSIATIPFAQLVFILMFVPNLKMKKKELSKSLFLGYILGGVTVIITILRDIAVLGNAFPFLWTIPEVVIPIITLIVIKIRKKGQVEIGMEVQT